MLPAAPGAGLLWGLLGVVAFSFTVPFTRVAVGGLSPLFIGSGRAVVAASLAAVALTATHQRLPRGRQWVRLAVVGGGIVVGFPLLTSYALTTAPASHGAVVIALLPAATATLAALRGHERPPVAFWVIAGLGALAAMAFASVQCGGLGQLHWADLLLFGAVVAAAIGYAEGGLLARELGAWQTVSWALVVCAPLMVLLALCRRSSSRRRRRRAVGGLRLPRRDQHVPRLLRLVPRPGHRPDGAGQPGAAGPARAHDLLGRPAAR